MTMLKNDNIEFCVVDTCHISVYSFSDTRTEAEQKLQDALENNKKDIETWKSHCKNYPDTELFKNYLKEAENKKYEIMTYDEFVQLERNYYLNQPLTEIDKETFDEMLNVLPPLKWCTRHNIEMFCMSEMLTGTYTSQYMFNLVTSKYYHKIVDILDDSTWGYHLLNAETC